MAYLLGIDIGTSGTKTVLFDEKGNGLASYTGEYGMQQPKNGWAEQHPEDWWEAVVDGIRAVLGKSGVDAAEIAGIGLSGQMHGLTMLDKDNKVLRPAIIWCDQRTAQECAEIEALMGGRDRLIAITANPALTGFTAGKIRWVQKHEPEIYEKCAHILLPKDYIRLMLTGEYATEVSDASGMQLLDIRNRCWSDEVLEKLNIDRALLGDMYESEDVTGKLTAEVAELTGLSTDCVVVGGAGDQAAAAIGNGIVEEGMLSDTIGTSGVIFATTDAPLIDAGGRVHTFCHAVRGKWHIMSVTQGAGLSLQWFRNNFCDTEKAIAAEKGTDVYNVMVDEAKEVAPGSDGVVFLPYLMGERSPILDPNAKGVFFGVTNATTRATMLRAVLEGITFSQRDCLSVIRDMGVNAGQIRMGGGGARNEYWRQIFADNLGCDITTVNHSEGGALGVAILAGKGAGIFDDVVATCNKYIGDTTRLTPNPCDGYERSFEKYLNVYKALKPLF